jgi:T-complex protein 1 subunit theta
MSKWDLRRLCKVIGATPLPAITAPTAEEMGHVSHVYIDEIGDTNVTVFKQDKQDSAIATVVVRGSSDNIMDDIERSVDDGVNTFKALTKDNRLVAGAGAVEMELSKHIRAFGETRAGLEQYAIQKFAQAFHVVPKALAENTGVKANEVISKLLAAHSEGQKYAGYDMRAGATDIHDAVSLGILDLYISKYWGIKFATTAACTVLKVDQIIMAKPSGGPKPKENKNWDED